ncbi:MAG: hypothetical protein IJO00_03630 [Clostridia bacterium]|nr:hypothetical protein [Clostridia bacterium]
MADNKLSEMISSSLESIRSIADSSTVIGDPIPTNNGTLVIPVSKISIGFASGGLDYLPKNDDKKEGNSSSKTQGKNSVPCFGGGGGTGVNVTPICFLVINSKGDVSMLNITNAATVPAAVGVIDSVSGFANKLPDIIEKFKNVFAKKTTEDSLDDEKLEEAIENLEK